MGRLSGSERDELWDRWEAGESSAVDSERVGSFAVNGEDAVVVVWVEASGACRRVVCPETVDG